MLAGSSVLGRIAASALHGGARAIAAAAGAALLALGVAACGGSSHSRSTAHKRVAAVPPATAPTSTASTTRTRSHGKPRPAKPKPRTKAPARPASHTTTHTTTTHVTTSQTTTTHATSTTTTSRTSSTTAPAYTPPIHASLVGQDHHPIANKLWSYTVTATDANGRPLPGTVETEFTFNGVVVGHETPPTHPLTDGRLHDSVTFPPAAVGHPLDVQVVVHTPIGSVTLDWFVETRPA